MARGCVCWCCCCCCCCCCAAVESQLFLDATGLVGCAALWWLLLLAFAEGSEPELPSFVRFFLRNEPKEGMKAG
ncbi:hypothetical protein V8C26DRAFT_395397 [Trichoderma gracile]